jgi:hypothetical protein
MIDHFVLSCISVFVHALLGSRLRCASAQRSTAHQTFLPWLVEDVDGTGRLFESGVLLETILKIMLQPIGSIATGLFQPFETAACQITEVVA